MNHATQIINQVLPILLLLFLGNRLRKFEFVSENTMEELKKLVVYLALPAVLFTAFLDIAFKIEYLALLVVVFLLCAGSIWMGRFSGKLFSVRQEMFPFMTSGYEYGMLGVSLFGSAYGLENIGYIAVVDLGHEFFIWFVFVPMLLILRDKDAGGGAGNKMGALLGMIFKSPVILAILAGIALNLLGARDSLYELPVLGAVMSSLQFLAQLTIPLILLIVGYGIKFQREGLRDVVLVAAVRFSVFIPLALLLNVFFLRGILGLGKPFEIALLALFILPPPFVAPLFIHPEKKDDMRYVNNVLSMGAVFSIVAFTILLILNPTLS